MRRAAVLGLVGLMGAVLLAALIWITRTTLTLERETQEQVVWEESVRVALWRMDAKLAALVALENARPADDFYSEEVTLLLTEQENEPGLEARFSGEELNSVIHARFEGGPNRTFVSAPVLDLAQRNVLAPAVGAEPVDPDSPWVEILSPSLSPETLEPLSKAPSQQSVLSQAQLNTLGFSQRQELNQQGRFVEPSGQILTGLFPRWIGEELVLVRSVDRSGEVVYQGSWLDWQVLEGRLLEEVQDLLPGASLVAAEPDADPGRRLALVPVRLVTGPLPEVAVEPNDSIRFALWVTWAAVLLALGAGGFLFAGVLRLSRRRAEFASAVTHELRTPLTTFRLYSEMLAEGMVEEEEQASYLETLRQEADRLGVLVENVLAYSRLEDGAVPEAVVPVRLGDLLERILPSLEQRAERATVSLQANGLQDVADEKVLVAPVPVEQILSNLVDNACKYGCNPQQPIVQLSARLEPRHAVLIVRDWGVGVAPGQRRRLFRPFHRSAEHAAGGQPGVGLGLALSRRLARSVGGTLNLRESEEGALFELRLPRSR